MFNYPTATVYSLKGAVAWLHTDRQIFRDEMNNAYPVKGVTAFNLMDRYAKGDDIIPFLNAYPQTNTIRVFCYTPKKDWGDYAWNTPSPNVVESFIKEMQVFGIRVKLVLLTDDDSARIQPAIELVEYLSPHKFNNLILATANEPYTHKYVNVNALEGVLKASGYLYTSGVYEDLKLFYGNCGDIHTGRDNEWPRKAKDAIECYRGGGPNFPDEPPQKVPWILGEPIKPNEANGDDNYILRDYYTYGALGKLTSGGMFFHCESAKLSNLPDDFESRCANELFTGYDMFPGDAALGDYEHLQAYEDEGTRALRVYRVGRYVVVVRPENFIPGNNWLAMDSISVCWTIL